MALGAVPRLTSEGHPRRFRATALVVIAAALALALYIRSGDADERWPTLDDDASGVTVTHPANWGVQRVGRYCRRIGPGVLVSNVRRHRFRNVEILNGCTNQWDFTGLPPRYVVVDVSLFSAPPHGQEPETPLPLLLARFRSHPNGSAFEHVRRNGNDYSVRVWFGPSASSEDQDAAALLVRSLDFGPLVSP